VSDEHAPLTPAEAKDLWRVWSRPLRRDRSHHKREALRLGSLAVRARHVEHMRQIDAELLRLQRELLARVR
jgi:hypothetical protein